MKAIRVGKKTLHAALLVACVGLASCGDTNDNAMLEIAGELRAIRLAQQNQPVAAPPSQLRNTTGSGGDRAEVANALAPLREALDGLSSEQKELAARQLALTQELQRWSQLLAQSVTNQARPETEALSARLQQLEANLKAQEQRHREVEALLTGALDRTADRLEDFLKRLDATAPAGKPTPVTPNDAPATGAPSGPPGNTEPGADGAVPKSGAPAPAVRNAASSRRQSLARWWIGLLGLAAVVGIGFAWRLRRGSVAENAAVRQPADTSLDGVLSERTASNDAPGFDQGVEEIWAAAALLGEAVGRLRQADAPPEDEAPPAAPLADDDVVDLDDLFVLDDDLGAAPAAPTAEKADVPMQPAAEPRATADAQRAANPPAARSERVAPAPQRPAELACRVRAANPARAAADLLRLLGEDPRVLRRPEPTVTFRADVIEVHFAVLPALPAGERTQLEQRLRDAVA